MIYAEFGLGHHYWHEPSKTVFCVPPKCGCSAMKYALLMASHPHFGVLFDGDTSRVHHFSHLTMVKRKSQIMQAERRIMIARDPVRRMLSAFLSKFVLNPEPHITQSVCNFTEFSADDLSFRQFALALDTIPDTYLDAHFRSQEDFLVMRIEDYAVVSLDIPSGQAYSSLLNGISPGSVERYFSLLAHEETTNHGALKDGTPVMASGTFADMPVKQLRYLRMNGSPLPVEAFAFEGLMDIAKRRYAMDFQINAMGKAPDASA